MAPTILLDVGHTWRYMATEPTGSWAAPDYDDSAWSAGPAGFGWGYGAAETTIGGSGSGLTVWARAVVPASGGPWSVTAYVDNAMTVYLDGSQVFTGTYGPQFQYDFTLWPSRGERVVAMHGTGDGVSGDLALLVIRQAHTVAPPCRLFPRADDLGVGSGRRYPPPKSQQRSSRRFGYY